MDLRLLSTTVRAHATSCAYFFFCFSNPFVVRLRAGSSSGPPSELVHEPGRLEANGASSTSSALPRRRRSAWALRMSPHEWRPLNIGRSIACSRMFTIFDDPLFFQWVPFMGVAVVALAVYAEHYWRFHRAFPDDDK